MGPVINESHQISVLSEVNSTRHFKALKIFCWELEQQHTNKSGGEDMRVGQHGCRVRIQGKKHANGEQLEIRLTLVIQYQSLK